MFLFQQTVSLFGFQPHVPTHLPRVVAPRSVQFSKPLERPSNLSHVGSAMGPIFELEVVQCSRCLVCHLGSDSCHVWLGRCHQGFLAALWGCFPEPCPLCSLPHNPWLFLVSGQELRALVTLPFMHFCDYVLIWCQ